MQFQSSTWLLVTNCWKTLSLWTELSPSHSLKPLLCILYFCAHKVRSFLHTYILILSMSSFLFTTCTTLFILFFSIINTLTHAHVVFLTRFKHSIWRKGDTTLIILIFLVRQDSNSRYLVKTESGLCHFNCFLYMYMSFYFTWVFVTDYICVCVWIVCLCLNFCRCSENEWQEWV